jgi:hypothetical protein
MPDPDIAALIERAAALQRDADAWTDTCPERSTRSPDRLAEQATAWRLQAAALRVQIATREAARKKDLAAIHAQAKKAGLDEDTRRLLIERISQGRTRSSADLTAAERAAVLRELGGAVGAAPRRDGASSRTSLEDAASARGGPPTIPKPAHVSEPQWRYIQGLYARLHLTEPGFARLVRHITGLDNPEWLDVPRARALIAGLRKMALAPPPKRHLPARGNPGRPH